MGRGDLTDGGWEQLLQQVQAAADAAGRIDWDVSVDSTVARAHQHAAGARTMAPPAVKGEAAAELQDEAAAWTGLLDLLVEVVRQVRGLAVPAKATRYDKRGCVFLGTVTTVAIVIWLRT